MYLRQLLAVFSKNSFWRKGFTGPTGRPNPHSRDRPSPGEAPATSKEQHLNRNAPNPTVWLPPFNVQEKLLRSHPCAQLSSIPLHTARFWLQTASSQDYSFQMNSIPLSVSAELAFLNRTAGATNSALQIAPPARGALLSHSSYSLLWANS